MAKRADLQKLAKEHGIKANKTNMQLIEELRKVGVIVNDGGGDAMTTMTTMDKSAEERNDETAAVACDEEPVHVYHGSITPPPACVSVMADDRSDDEKLDQQKKAHKHGGAEKNNNHRIVVDNDEDDEEEDVDGHNAEAKPANTETVDSVVARCNDDGMAQAPTISTLSRGRSDMTIQQHKQWPQPQSRRVEDKTYPHFSAPTLDEYEQHRLQLQSAGFTTLFSPASVTKSVAMVTTNVPATRTVRPIELAEATGNASAQLNTTAVEAAADATHGLDETTSAETDPVVDDSGVDAHGSGVATMETADPKLLQETTNMTEKRPHTLPNGSVSKIGKPPRLAAPSVPSGGVKRQTSTASSKFSNAKSSKIHRK